MHDNWLNIFSETNLKASVLSSSPDILFAIKVCIHKGMRCGWCLRYQN